MSKVRIYNYDDKDLPDDLKNVLNIVLNTGNEPKKQSNSLHDIFIRKKLTCFCTICRDDRLKGI